MPIGLFIVYVGELRFQVIFRVDLNGSYVLVSEAELNSTN
jgi:hypothetical protein